MAGNECQLFQTDNSQGSVDMDVWQMILYAVASVLALRSLVSLMSQHRERFRRHELIRAQNEINRMQQADSNGKPSSQGEAAA